MKKLVLILLTAVAMVACNSNNEKYDEGDLRETAKKDIMEKMDLPEGTKFDEKDMEVSTNPENGEGPNVEYIVKVTIKSQNEDGKEMVETHKMHYKKRENAEAKAEKERYELTSFE